MIRPEWAQAMREESAARWWLTALIALLLSAFACLARAQAAPRDAVVILRSHGCSGTVISTRPGRTIILTCAHAFEGRDGEGVALRTKPLVIEGPHPAPGAAGRPGMARLIGLGKANVNDLALIELPFGPLPYVCPVAPAGTVADWCKSVGYDEMKLPAQDRWARIRTAGRQRTETDQRPWHGRSGGALIDRATGRLVGVVSGYTGPKAISAAYHREVIRGEVGIYASHGAVLAFVGRYAPEALGGNSGIPEFRNRPATPYYAQPTPWAPRGC